MRLAKMEDILALISVDYYAPVQEIIDLVHINDPYHQKLKAKMLEDGENKVPILVEDQYDDGVPMLGNGHHRVRIAYEAGWTHMWATDQDQQSGYGDLEGVII